MEKRASAFLRISCARYRPKGWIEWTSAALTSMFVGASFVRAWFMPSGGHFHRQSDTAGVALSMAQTWADTGVWDWLRTLFYPAVLQRGTGNGINPMEFPLLNFLSSPLFLLGARTGIAFTVSLLLLLHVWVALKWIPRLISLPSLAVRPWIGALILFSQYSVTFNAGIFMPEGLAFPLACIGLTWIKERSFARGIILFALACAIKPPIVVAALVLVLNRQKARDAARSVAACAVAILPALAWYLIHCPSLIAQSTGPIVFASLKLDPWGKLQWAGMAGSWSLFMRQINGYHLPFWVGPWMLAVGVLLQPWAALGVVLAFVGGLSLIGPAGAQHAYYFFGTSVVSSLFLARLLEDRRPPRWWKPTVAWGCMIGMLYCIREPLWILSKTPNYWSLGGQAHEKLRELRALGPIEVITDDRDCPSKLLFAETRGMMTQGNIQRLGEHCRLPGRVFLIDDELWKEEAVQKDACMARLQSVAFLQNRDLRWRILKSQ